MLGRHTSPAGVPGGHASEHPVGDVAKELGMTVAAVSNQLRKMTDLGFLARSSRGNFVFYRVVDSCVGELLHRAYCLAREGKARRRII